MRLCGITEADLFAELRQRGIYELDGLRYILYEPKGGLTIVPVRLGRRPCDGAR